MNAIAQELSHVYPAASRITPAGRLEIAGCDAVELAREFGTPAYVVSEEDLRERARGYLGAFGARHPDAGVVFGAKAFPCTAVLAVFAQEGLGCDVASGGELHLARRAGVAPERIYLHGNAKDEQELRAARAAGVGHVVVDSFDDIERLEAIEPASGSRQRVLVRVTPDVRPATHAAIATGQADSKFGLSSAEAGRAIARLERSERLQLAGLHVHIGSQVADLDFFRAAVAAIAPLGDFPVYNLGGGLATAYAATDRPPSIDAYADAIVGAADELLGAGKRILVEPGRSLVANAGVTLYSVVTVKPGTAATWVAVDGGMSDNLRPMLYGARYEALIAGRAAVAGDTACHVAGKHCESGDVLVRDVLLPGPRRGDVLATPATGAYGHALANNYNGVPRPPVIFCRDGDARVVVRRETHEDLTARDVA